MLGGGAFLVHAYGGHIARWQEALDDRLTLARVRLHSAASLRWRPSWPG